MNNLYNPKYLIELCQKYRIIPSKKYGQNFLISKAVIEKIIEESNLKKSDTIVEVGPGFGVLTLALAEKVKKVIAFEIEKKLENYWEEINPSALRTPPLRKGRTSDELEKEAVVTPAEAGILKDDNERDSLVLQYDSGVVPSLRRRGEGVVNNIEIIWGNVLKQVENLKIKDYKVVANIPYQITSNVIRKFLELKNKPKEMVLMVQKEVGERICAKPGQMSVLAVSVQYYADPKILFNVKRTKFFPEPKVDSVVIKLEIKNKNLGASEKDFFKVVRVGFASKRKMLIKNLSVVYDREKIENSFEELNLNKKIRAQELSVEEWVRLSELLV